MNFGFIRYTIIIVFALVCAPLFGQPPATPVTTGSTEEQHGVANDSDLNKIFQSALAAFQERKWSEAINQLETFIKTITPESNTPVQQQFEPVYYTLAASYFNLPDYTKALAAFKDFIVKYPKSARLADATMAMAQCNALKEPKDLDESARLFASLEGTPSMREQALLAKANVFKLQGNPDKAIDTYERMIAQGITSSNGCDAAIALAQLYVDKKEVDKALEIFARILSKQYLVENLIQLNSLLLSLGDRLVEAGNYQQALNCYRYVLSRDEVINSQRQRLLLLKKQLEDTQARVRANPMGSSELLSVSNDLGRKITEAESFLSGFENLADFAPSMYLRYVRCYGEMNKQWECILLCNDILDKYKDATFREPALYSLIVAYIKANRVTQAQQNCEIYLKDFPQGTNAASVGYLLGTSALQENNPAKAESYFGRLLVDQPGSKFKNEIEFMLANTKFMQGKFDEAVKGYKQYITDFPDGANVEESNYRIALAQLQNGGFQEAMEMFADYLHKYPSGLFAQDAKYRLTICYYAVKDYDKVRELCEDWEKTFPGDPQLGEVLALKADMYAAIDEDQAAISTYLRSYQAAQTDEVLSYSLFAATKLMQKLGQWDNISQVFEDFVKTKPNHPLAASAIFWIGKAKARTGHPEEAKKFYAETIKKYYDNPAREGVDQMISQLVILCMKKPLPPTDGTPAKTFDPQAELDGLLGAMSGDMPPPTQARILFAKAEISRLLKQLNDEERTLKLIADQFKSEDLSPLILGHVGDFLLSKGDMDKASVYYNQLKTEYPKSEYVDYAYAGLGEIAFQKKDYNTALDYFTSGTDKIGAEQKLKDITVGKAKTLLALGKLDDARKLFEQVASVRAWRGESTAFSIYSLGELEMKEQKWPEANAYFHKVYVGYQKFPAWMAKSYIKSGECFEKQSRTQDAINTYHEMLNNQKLQNLPEAETARQRLKELGAA